jgi:hypothetical protein
MARNKCKYPFQVHSDIQPYSPKLPLTIWVPNPVTNFQCQPHELIAEFTMELPWCVRDHIRVQLQPTFPPNFFPSCSTARITRPSFFLQTKIISSRDRASLGHTLPGH